ncbi:MAG: hypothetical protein A4E30_00242 [Methanomassiliicoccales archaeon PtaB.Bin215]|nr:MAG: hypothetical protein A4E30_00242 [Methanomassiliicoccales archaeon PtaB.Bin215]
MDQSLLDDPGMTVELYWTNEEGWVWTTWNYYGRDPTPGDGQFPVDYAKLDGDARYGWFIRVKNAAHQADDNAPGMWDEAEAHTRVNILDPLPVHNNYPLAPAPGTSLILRWESSDDEFFHHYEVFYGRDPDFTPSSSNRISTVNGRYTTQLTVTDTMSGGLYYFIIRVVDIDGRYSDSNVNFTRTYQNVDTAGSGGSARVVMAGTAWTEDTTMWLDEEDLYAIYLNAGQSLTVDMIGNTMGGGDLHAYGVNGQLITSSALPGVTESVHLTATVSGYYFVMVTTPTVGTDWYTLWFHVR